VIAQLDLHNAAQKFFAQNTHKKHTTLMELIPYFGEQEIQQVDQSA
jgi:hypothetical protein